MTQNSKSNDREPRNVATVIALVVVSLVIAFFVLVGATSVILPLADAFVEKRDYTKEQLEVSFIVFAIAALLCSLAIGIYSAKLIERWFGVPAWLREFNVKFDFSGEIGRFKFAKMQVLGLVIIVVSNLIVVFAGSGVLAILVSMINIIVLIKFLIAPTAQRTRSLGLNPWLALVLLVPLVNFAFYIFLLAGPEGAARSLRRED